MRQHQDLLKMILQHGSPQMNERTKIMTQSLFGPQLSFDMSQGFPLCTTRKINFTPLVKEILWMLSGSTSAKELNDVGCKIWDPWAVTAGDIATREDRMYISTDRVGDLGPIYGKQWRQWDNGDGTFIDQIQNAFDLLKSNPTSRRICVTAWNPTVLPDEKLTPQQNVLNDKACLASCHAFFQFNAAALSINERAAIHFGNRFDHSSLTQENRTHIEYVARLLNDNNVPTYKLSLKLTARSQDVPVGTVFNIAQYSLLLHIFAHTLNMVPGNYVHSCGDAHIYQDQIEGVQEQLSRTPRPLPNLVIKNKRDSVFDYKLEDFELEGYDPCSPIKFPVAV